MSEVRRCSSCAEPAVIVVREWGTSTMIGGSTGRVSRWDHRCQSCGTGFRVLPWHVVRTVVGGVLFFQLLLIFLFVGVMACMGALEAPLFSMALGLFGWIGVLVMGAGCWWSVSSSWYLFRNPVVAEATVPPLRFGEKIELRSCSCGKPARAVKTVANTTNGVPTGKETTFLCACGQEFVIYDLWGICFHAIIGAIVFPLGLVLAQNAWEDPGAWTIGTAAVVTLAGLFGGFVLSALGARNRWLTHPVVDTPTP